jgi:hypothetical protein
MEAGDPREFGKEYDQYIQERCDFYKTFLKEERFMK